MVKGKAKKKTPSILLIDDEVAILHALGFHLKQEGYKVEVLAKFHNYVAQLSGPELPDVIILDILLSGENGAKIAKELKSHSHTKHIPIILISALPNAKEISEKAGADAFLAKPFDLDKLDSVVHRLVK